MPAALSPRRVLRTLPLAAAIFFCVSGGPFGLEPVMRSGAAVSLLLILVTPILWAAPAAMMTAELASAIPEEGGYYIWVRQALGPFAGFLCGWWSWVYSWVDAAIYPTLFAKYLAALFELFGHPLVLEGHPVQSWAIGMAIVIAFTWLNLRGARVIGESSIAFVAILTVPFIIMIALGVPKLLHPFAAPLMAPNRSLPDALTSGLFVVMWNYLGWDSLSTVAGEVENPQRSFPRALLIGLPFVTALYALSAWVGLAAEPNLEHWTEGAWPAVATRIGGQWLGIAVAAAGVVGAAGLFSATLLAGSRVPYALAKDGYLPPILARLHPRYLTPWPAIWVSACVYAVLSYSAFEKLAEIDVVLYSAGLVLELVALVALRFRRPDLERPFRVPGGLAGVLVVAVLPAAMIVFALVRQFQEQNPVTALLSAGAIATGFVLYPFAKLQGPLQKSSPTHL